MYTNRLVSILIFFFIKLDFITLVPSVIWKWFHGLPKAMGRRCIQSHLLTALICLYGVWVLFHLFDIGKVPVW